MHSGEVTCVSVCENISSENTEERSAAFDLTSKHQKLARRVLFCPMPENFFFRCVSVRENISSENTEEISVAFDLTSKHQKLGEANFCFALSPRTSSVASLFVRKFLLKIPKRDQLHLT